MQNIEDSDLCLQLTDKKIEMIKELFDLNDIDLERDAELSHQRPSSRRLDQQ